MKKFTFFLKYGCWCHFIFLPTCLCDFSQDHGIINLPEKSADNWELDSYWVFGWGLLQENTQNFPNFLHWVRTPAVSYSVCEQNYADFQDWSYTENMVICAGDQGIDTCQGDSGGPLIQYGPNCTAVQFGIVNWGQGCGGVDRPGIYASTVNYLDWIQQNKCTASSPNSGWSLTENPCSSSDYISTKDTVCLPCESMHQAVMDGEINCFNQRISAGDDVNEVFRGTTTLYQSLHQETGSVGNRKKRSASIENYEEDVFDQMLTILLEQPGLDINIKTEINCENCTRAGDSVVHEAVIRGKINGMSKLIEKGADLNAANEFENNRQPIHEAGYFGEIGVLDLLVDNGVDIDTEDDTGTTALLYASQEGNLDAIQEIIDRGADVNLKNKAGFSAYDLASTDDMRNTLENNGASIINECLNNCTRMSLVLAIDKKCLKCVKELSTGDDINEVSPLTGTSVIHQAVRSGDIRILETITGRQHFNRSVLEFKTAAYCSQKWCSYGGDTALHEAVLSDFIPAVNHLISLGSDVNSKNTVRKNMQPIHYAAESSELAVQILIDNNANINAKDELGMTPLMRACYDRKRSKTGQTSTIMKLLDLGARINITNIFDRQAIHFAAEIHFTSALLTLVNNTDEDIVNAVDNKRETPLMFACKKRQSTGISNTITKLLDLGAQINMTNIKDRQAIHFAAYHHYVEAIQDLFDRDSNVLNVQDSKKDTPLMFACKRRQKTGTPDTIMKLLDLGAKVNMTNIFDRQAIHFAALYENYVGLDKLVDADNSVVNSQDNKGYTPLMFACRRRQKAGEPNTIIKLIDLGAIVNKTNIYDRQAIHETVFYWNMLEISSLVSRGANIDAKGTDGDTPLIQSCFKYPNDFNPKIYPDEENNDDFEEFKEPSPPPQVRKRAQMVRKVLREKANTNLKNNKGYTALKTIMTREVAFSYTNATSRKRRSLNQTSDDYSDLLDAMDSLIDAGATYSGKCYCQNGVAGEGETCPVEGDHFCSSCDTGYNLVVKQVNYTEFLKDSKFCVKSECICNGNPNDIEGIDCARTSKSDGIECPSKCFFHNLNKPALGGNSHCVQYQVSERANPNKFEDGTTPLYKAANKGFKEIVEIFAIDQVNHTGDLLWDPVADLDLKTTDDCKPNCTREGDTALHETVIQGFADIAKTLADNGANVNVENNNYNNSQPIHTAGQFGSSNTLAVLIDAGANINARDSTGSTCVFYAAKGGHLDTVHNAIAQNANLNIINDQNKTSLSVAMGESIENIIKKSGGTITGICRCDNGEGVREQNCGVSCHILGAESCLSCNSGFQLLGNMCVKETVAEFGGCGCDWLNDRWRADGSTGCNSSAPVYCQIANRIVTNNHWWGRDLTSFQFYTINSAQYYIDEVGDGLFDAPYLFSELSNFQYLEFYSYPQLTYLQPYFVRSDTLTKLSLKYQSRNSAWNTYYEENTVCPSIEAFCAQHVHLTRTLTGSSFHKDSFKGVPNLEFLELRGNRQIETTTGDFSINYFVEAIPKLKKIDLQKSV